MRLLAVALTVGALCGCPAPEEGVETPAPPPTISGHELLPVEFFLDAFSPDTASYEGCVAAIESRWHPSYAPLVLELVRFSVPQRASELLALLRRTTGHEAGRDFEAWWSWVWESAPPEHPDYARFKGLLYRQVDERFEAYFKGEATIRLDEIRWGGVRRDGIPPLKDPRVVSAGEAGYLNESDVVFGVTIGETARAYPKRILAWHEMVKDTVGDTSICGVYCTLCGSMIVYRTEIEGTHIELGTSGFLYRSNKLMYDRDTESLWSTLEGRPVVGPLVGQGLELEPLWVVTTTWGQWRALHPETSVLSLETGFDRDYGEGVAYRDYFASDSLMFGVPGERDTRLANKAEVFVARVGATPLAISAEFLARVPVYSCRVGEVPFVVLTDDSGANRAYELGEADFVGVSGDGVRDANDVTWEIHEDRLAHGERTLARLPAHRAFWFAWHAAHPDSKLVH